MTLKKEEKIDDKYKKMEYLNFNCTYRYKKNIIIAEIN